MRIRQFKAITVDLGATVIIGATITIALFYTFSNVIN